MYRYLMVTLLSVLAASCNHDNLLVPKPNENLRPATDFIKNNYDFRLFNAALEYTGLAGELNGPGPFTVLAIPDQGFNYLGILTEAQVRRLNKDSLLQALRYHVLKNRRLQLGDIPTNGVDIRYETLSGESVYVTGLSRSKTFYVDGARINRSDIVLSNGILHVLNKPMQYHKGKKVQDHLSENPQYSIYVAGLKKFGLWDELAGKGPFTIYAPDDSAFIAQGITKNTIDTMTTALYRGDRLFGAYILYGNHFFISDLEVARNGGQEIYYKQDIRNDTWFCWFQATQDKMTNPGDGFNTPYPEITMLKPSTNPGNPTIVRGVVQNTNSLMPLVWYDHLCENGIVHQMHGLLVLPAEALK